MKKKNPLRDSLTPEERKFLRKCGLENPFMSTSRCRDKINADRMRCGIIQISNNGFRSELNRGGVKEGYIKGYNIPKDIVEVKVEVKAEVNAEVGDTFPNEDISVSLTENAKTAATWLLAGATWRMIREILHWSWDIVETTQIELLVSEIFSKGHRSAPWRCLWTSSDFIFHGLFGILPTQSHFAQVQKMEFVALAEKQDAEMQSAGIVFTMGKFMPIKQAKRLEARILKVKAEQEQARRDREYYGEDNRDQRMLERLLDNCREPMSWAKIVRIHGWSYIQSERYKKLAVDQNLIRKVDPDNRFDDRYVIAS